MYLKEELICALREIKKIKNKILKQKEQLQKYEEEHDSKVKISHSPEKLEKIIIILNIQLEEAKGRIK